MLRSLPTRLLDTGAGLQAADMRGTSGTIAVGRAAVKGRPADKKTLLK